MKKIAAIILCFVVAVLVVLLIIGAQKNWFRGEPAPVSSQILYNSTSNIESSQESSAVSVMAPTHDSYTVREYSGHIAVFKNNDTLPYHEIEADVTTLPPEDQLRLQQGITVSTEEEVQSILEDYGS